MFKVCSHLAYQTVKVVPLVYNAVVKPVVKGLTGGGLAAETVDVTALTTQLKELLYGFVTVATVCHIGKLMASLTATFCGATHPGQGVSFLINMLNPFVVIQKITSMVVNQVHSHFKNMLNCFLIAITGHNFIEGNGSLRSWDTEEFDPWNWTGNPLHKFDVPNNITTALRLDDSNQELVYSGAFTKGFLKIVEWLKKKLEEMGVPGNMLVVTLKTVYGVMKLVGQLSQGLFRISGMPWVLDQVGNGFRFVLAIDAPKPIDPLNANSNLSIITYSKWGVISLGAFYAFAASYKKIKKLNQQLSGKIEADNRALDAAQKKDDAVQKKGKVDVVFAGGETLDERLAKGALEDTPDKSTTSSGNSLPAEFIWKIYDTIKQGMSATRVGEIFETSRGKYKKIGSGLRQYRKLDEPVVKSTETKSNDESNQHYAILFRF